MQKICGYAPRPEVDEMCVLEWGHPGVHNIQSGAARIRRSETHKAAEWYDPGPLPGQSLAEYGVTNRAALLNVLDWTFSVYSDGSLLVRTPRGREGVQMLEIALGPPAAAALRELLVKAESAQSAIAMQAEGELDPTTIGRVV